MRATPIALACLLVLAVAAPTAGAASIAYVDGGEVWLSSLDGARKARLATPVVNGAGQTEKWLAVAASDSGRIVATRNVPGRQSSFSWFKTWEPDGSSTVEGPLNAPSGWAIYVYPLSFDITADGHHLVYGYSNSGFCCPISFGRGTYVRPATNSSFDPIVISGEEHPTILGSRVIANAGSTVSVQDPSTTYGTDFQPWIDTAGTGYEQRRTDVAANGALAALELVQWDTGSQTVGKIAVLSIQGVDQPPTFPAAVDCYLPTNGVASEASLSQDAARIAWTDDDGLKVAGTPTTTVDPCAPSSPPVVISPTASQGSIGGANVDAFLPVPPPGGPPGPAPPGATSPRTPGATPDVAPVASVSGKATLKALAGTKGLAVKVKVAKAGKVKISATVPAAVLGRKGKRIVVATGATTARRAGTVTVRLRLTAAGRKKPKRLKGARLTLRVRQGDAISTKRIKLR